jgi:hypothetical protein
VRFAGYSPKASHSATNLKLENIARRAEEGLARKPRWHGVIDHCYYSFVVEDKLCTMIPAEAFRVHFRLSPGPLESLHSIGESASVQCS